jgi:IS1 family transposase
VDLWKKKNKVWLSYAYHRESGEIVAYVWGNWDIKTAEKLKERIFKPVTTMGNHLA